MWEGGGGQDGVEWGGKWDNCNSIINKYIKKKKKRKGFHGGRGGSASTEVRNTAPLFAASLHRVRPSVTLATQTL